MKEEHVQELLIEYLDSTLTEAQRKMVTAHVKDCSRCSEELAQLQTMFKAFDKEVPAIPPSSIKTNFLKQLANEEHRVSKEASPIAMRSIPSTNWVPNSLKLAASVALLIGAFLTGKYQASQKSNVMVTTLKTEGNEIRETAMLALMENKSASRRIQGVNFVVQFENPDEEIVSALTDRMLHDENVNVRSAAVDALSRFLESEAVKTAFIRALGTEKDPSIQIAVLQNLVHIQEKKAVGPMKKLLEQEDTQPFVKKEINKILSGTL